MFHPFENTSLVSAICCEVERVSFLRYPVELFLLLDFIHIFSLTTLVAVVVSTR